MGKLITEYVVSFRTEQAGGYKWLKRGQSRGYYRVLEIAAEATGYDMRHRGVREAACTRSGIVGVTKRSAYYIDAVGMRAEAARRNRELAAAHVATIATCGYLGIAGE